MRERKYIMIFSDINENKKIIDRLKNAVACGNVSHAYIFEGDMCTAKDVVANCFAKAILCKEHPAEGCDSCVVCNKIEHGNHEDVFYVEKEGNSIKDEAVEDMQERLKTKPNGERNIAIVKDADTMTLRAQNRLLKTLEEPPVGTVIMLLSENTENLINTILSRCVIIRLSHSAGMTDEAMQNIAAEAAADLIARKPFFELKEKLADIIEERDAALEFLDALENFYGNAGTSRDKASSLYPKAYIYKATEIIEETRRDIKRNVSVSYAMKNLLLKLSN